MKNYIKYTIYFLTVFLFSSCEDAVDIQPTDVVVGNASSINSLDAARKAVNGSYIFISGNPTSFGDIAADNVRVAPSNTGQGMAFFNWTYNQVSPIGPWIGQYNILRNVNIVLANIQDIDAENNESTKNQIIAEALALRAAAHFELLRNFSAAQGNEELGIPLELEPIEASQQPPRNTVQEVYDQIEADLQEAIQTFPEDGFVQLDFFSKASTYALASRVALYKGEWQEAIDYAENALANTEKEIATRDEYPRVWRDESDAGVIFSELRGNLSYNASFNRVTNEDKFFFGSTELYDLYEDNDIRKEFNFNVLSEDLRQYEVNKWPPVNTITAIDGKVFRVEELYLNIAEAQARLGDLNAAADAINAIRSNRIENYTNIDYNNQNEAIADVLKERRLELAFEGHRMYDLKRLGLPVERDNFDCINNECFLEANSNKFVAPIALAEMTANANMVQFPGY